MCLVRFIINYLDFELAKTKVTRKKIVNKPTAKVPARIPTVKGKRQTAEEKRNRRSSSDYIARFASYWYEDKELEQIADLMYDYMMTKGNYWIKDFATENGFNPSKFIQFARENEYFADIYAICKAIQESKLIKLGMSRPQMPIFILKSVHKLSENQENKDSLLPELPNVDGMKDDEIDKIYERILNLEEN